MSRLDELVQELCPNGVTYKKLVDAVSIERGKRVVRSQLSTSGKYPVYQNSLTPLGYHTDYNYNANTTFIIVAGAAGEIGFSDKAFWAADDCFTVVCPENVLNRYIYHLLLNNQNQLASKVRKASIPRLSRSAIENLVIPIPPLDVQREIVRILDNFTNLTAELTAELTARKNQYEFYRDKLLTYDSKTKIMPLKDVAEIERGTRVVRSQLTEDGLYPVFQNALTPMGYNDKANRLGNNTFLICAGAAGQIGYSDVDFWAADDCYTFKCCEKLENRYLFHVLKNNQHRIDAQVRRASIPRISREAVGNIRIPIPPLDVQNRIVNVLDNFEKICSDLNIGLPAEIEARQKQYEYYRDKLLTFAETGNTILNGTERNGTLIKLLRYVFGYVRIPLGDVGSICMCKRILKSQTNTASGVPFYKIGTFGKEADAYISQETFDEYRSRYNFPKKGDVLISAAGTIGRTVVYDGKPAYFQDSNIVWIDNDESIVLNSYLRYCYELKPWKASEGGTIPRLYNDNIAKAVIAIPSIEKQKRIVSILDRFDAICNDLTSGLPAEIEARRKQYEYYRDKLLSFKELI